MMGVGMGANSANSASCADNNAHKLRFFRERIPSFACVPGCHDCCGPVTTSTLEMARLPLKTEAEHDAALQDLSCPHLGPAGCQAYDERPLICRLFGTTPRLLCPRGRRPEVMVSPAIEQQINRYFIEVRHVLV